MRFNMVNKSLQWCHENKCKKLEAIFINDGQQLEVDFRWKGYLVSLEIDTKTDLTNMTIIKNGNVVNEFGLPYQLCFSVLDNMNP
jgi:hypothetical protein